MANRKQRRHPGRPAGMTYADELARKKVFKEAAQKAAEETMVKLRSDARAQRMLWLMMLSLNDADQYGKVKYERLTKALEDRTEWYQEMECTTDKDYADEKLRREVERVTKSKASFLYEDEIRKGKQSLDWTEGCNYDLIRRMSVKEMARFIPAQILGLGENAALDLAQGAWESWLRDHTGGKV